jgi:hypothetical protein
MAVNFSFMKSQKGKDLLVVDEYTFSYDKKYNGSVYWRCTVSVCKRRAITRDGNFEKFNKEEHSHAPDTKNMISRTTTNALKRKVDEEPTRPAKQIYNQVLQEIQHELAENFDEVAVGLKTFDSVATIIYRQKRRHFPHQSRHRKDIFINGEFAVTKNGDQFLLAEEGEEEKILVFGTVAFLQKLCNADYVYMDGTFKVVPNLFLQLYTLHGLHNGEMIPYIYALLPNKNQEIYRRLFRLLQDKAAENNLIFNPRNFQIDFEFPVVQSLRVIFPNAAVHGCLFHFTQCIWRKVQNLGLTKLFRDNREVRRTIRRVAALPFLRLEDIDDAWLTICAEKPDFSALEQFMDYVVFTWIGDDEENTAKFSREMWNHHNNFGPRTTNHIEGWHYCLNRAIGKSHPNLFEFINSIKEQQAKFERM